ncbi:AzlC family ABC transporter permease [Kocuria sp. cx-455]|uniref:AzlC family ABC transporter permease n=1 Tax=unclassified Candidatus Sulfotelmatobacter TaxID=2635724 RepID=UPI00168463F1|nr:MULTISPECIES: AzlC family ABC transporter permease [unclassified Candidatus Sulfotelmatobacter]MBD2761965.1 AzlC family ABC transporter permease [Kocuria sp. cx-116]MBD2763804.1 AzlC family ABC transporter permease [Kocuria sp. cx-455]
MNGSSSVTVGSESVIPWRSSPAVRVGLSLGIATGLYGISFGALSIAAGLTFWQTQALSALMFTGGSQFAFIGVLSGGGTGAAALGAASLLGVRNTVYGMTMNALLRPRSWRKAVAAQVTIDESNAAASAQPTGVERKRGFWVAGVSVFLLWNLFTAVGALLGDAVGDPGQWGLDGAAVAAFLGLLWPRLRDREPLAVAVVCGVVTAISIPLVPSGIPVLVAAVVALAWGLVGARSARKTVRS